MNPYKNERQVKVVVFFRKMVIVLSIATVVQMNAPHVAVAKEAEDGLPKELIAMAELDYYNPQLLPRYIEIAKKMPDASGEAVVVQVNIGLDRPFYQQPTTAKDADSVLVLCNKYSKLEKDYVPKDLTDFGGGMWMKAEAGTAFNQMRTALQNEGLHMTVRSTYRSYATQNYIYNNNTNQYGAKIAEATVARPGHSEHQTGLAIDVVQAGFKGSPLSNANFQDTDQYKWLLAHGHEYGFILRYPQGKEGVTGFSFEPWHWRYVGVLVATTMKDNAIPTFDEYCAINF